MNFKHSSDFVSLSLFSSNFFTNSSKYLSISSVVKSGNSSEFVDSTILEVSEYDEYNTPLYFFSTLYLSMINFLVVSSFFTKSTNLLIRL